MSTRRELERSYFRLLDFAAAACSFAFGVAVGLIGVVFFSADNPDIDRLGLGIILAIPLAITPLIYIIGLAFQEAASRRRSRITRLVSAGSSGLLYVLLMGAASKLTDSLTVHAELPSRLFGVMMVILWLSGPLIVGFMLFWIERRMVSRLMRDESAS